jgi:hypothetical protein
MVGSSPTKYFYKPLHTLIQETYYTLGYMLRQKNRKIKSMANIPPYPDSAIRIKIHADWSNMVGSSPTKYLYKPLHTLIQETYYTLGYMLRQKNRKIKSMASIGTLSGLRYTCKNPCRLVKFSWIF